MPLDHSLTFGDLLRVGEIDPDDVLAIRHTYSSSGIASVEGATEDAVREYTREQLITATKFPRTPPRWWAVFLAETGLRSRLVTVYESHGEVLAERTETHRYYDLRPASVLESLWGRLTVSWTKDAVNWAKAGARAAAFPVLEIADPEPQPFPGYDRLLVDFAELQLVVDDPRYRQWQTALGSVQAVYLIADRGTGRLYVGKADGEERLLGRWRTYARTGHGGNVELRRLVGIDPEQPQRYQFSILRVFGPQTPQHEVDASETHFKNALLTRSFGLNRN